MQKSFRKKLNYHHTNSSKPSMPVSAKSTQIIKNMIKVIIETDKNITPTIYLKEVERIYQTKSEALHQSRKCIQLPNIHKPFAQSLFASCHRSDT